MCRGLCWRTCLSATSLMLAMVGSPGEGLASSCFYGLKELPSKKCSTQPWFGGGAGRETT